MTRAQKQKILAALRRLTTFESGWDTDKSYAAAKAALALAERTLK